MKKALLWVGAILMTIAVIYLGIIGIVNFGDWAYPFIFIASYLLADTFFYFRNHID